MGYFAIPTKQPLVRSMSIRTCWKRMIATGTWEFPFLQTYMPRASGFLDIILPPDG
jgi:hypothetical protein